MTELRKITSRSNARIKAAGAIRDGKDKSHIFIEGVRLAEEVLASSVVVVEAFVSADFGHDNRKTDLYDQLRHRNIAINEVSASVATSLADTKSPQGIFLIAERPSDKIDQIKVGPGSPGIALYLYEANNPANLGAVLRTAAAASVAGVFLSTASCDPYSPKSLRASMGSAFHVPIYEEANIENVTKWAKSHDILITAVDVSQSKPYYELDWTKPRLLLFGSEAHGLTAALLDEADDRIHIPMHQGVESLNLAVACGVVLFEARRSNIKK